MTTNQSVRPERGDYRMDEIGELDFNQALVTWQYDEIERLKMVESNLRAAYDKKSSEHCSDCCCARSWKALGITDYTGKSIPEHILDLRNRASQGEPAAVPDRDLRSEGCNCPHWSYPRGVFHTPGCPCGPVVETHDEPAVNSKTWREIQNLRGSRARLSIELGIVEKLIDGEREYFMMEYWTDLHDKLLAALSGDRPAQTTPDEDIAYCASCGDRLEAVRPGKFQHVGPCIPVSPVNGSKDL